jgi:shikimate kinase
MDSKNKIKCLLLVGPIGAGKTPLGRVLKERGVFKVLGFIILISVRNCEKLRQIRQR